MRIFENPTMEMVEFEVEEIMAASTTSGSGSGIEEDSDEL